MYVKSPSCYNNIGYWQKKALNLIGKNCNKSYFFSFIECNIWIMYIGEFNLCDLLVFNESSVRAKRRLKIRHGL